MITKSIEVMKRDIADAKDLLSRMTQARQLMLRMRYPEECVDWRRDTLDSVLTLAQNDMRHMIAYWEKNLEEMLEEAKESER